MPAGLVLGGIGFSITIIDQSIMAIEFIIETVDGARTFGELTLKLKTRLTSECARLCAFNSFLQQENDAGTKRFSTLSSISQDAILGMIQELEILFCAYSDYLEKHNIEEMQRGYSSNMTLEKDTKQLVNRRKEEGKEAQDRASRWEAAKWALFEKKRIMALIDQIEKWNNTLWGLLLCGVCLGIEPSFTASDRDRGVL
jgi:hypothetical protein